MIKLPRFIQFIYMCRADLFARVLRMFSFVRPCLYGKKIPLKYRSKYKFFFLIFIACTQYNKHCSLVLTWDRSSMGEHCAGSAGVVGSNPIGSTTKTHLRIRAPVHSASPFLNQGERPLVPRVDPARANPAGLYRLTRAGHMLYSHDCSAGDLAR
jgi:hypothetical protein